MSTPSIQNLKKGASVWLSQLKQLTLDFSSGHDLTVHGFEPHIGLFTDHAEPAWDSLPLPLLPSCALSLYFSQNK